MSYITQRDNGWSAYVHVSPLSGSYKNFSFVANDTYFHSSTFHYSPVVPAPWWIGDVAQHHYRVGRVTQYVGRCLCLKLSVQYIPEIESEQQRVMCTHSALCRLLPAFQYIMTENERKGSVLGDMRCNDSHVCHLCERNGNG